jgi:phosphate transport system permease protein
LHIDRYLGAGLGFVAAAVAMILTLVMAFLVRESWPVFQAIDSHQFLTSNHWFPLEGHFGILAMALATIVTSLSAMLLAGFAGLSIAIFVVYLAPKKLALAYRNMLGLMAGIPSVVFGLWGLTVLVPMIAQWQPPGASLLAASLVLALMILPTVALTSQSALKALPQQLLQGGAALGFSRYRTIVSLAIPSAKGAILSGLLLAFTRAMGETMAVLMVAGNVPQIPESIFDPVRVLTANIALEMAYATGQHRAALFASGCLLMVCVAMFAWAATRVDKNHA